MAVAGPIYAATKSKRKAVLAATFSGFFEVLGLLLIQVGSRTRTPRPPSHPPSPRAGALLLCADATNAARGHRVTAAHRATAAHRRYSSMPLRPSAWSGCSRSSLV